MAEAVGVAASVIAIVSLAKTCIDFYAVVDDCRNASKDLDRLVSQFMEQRLRFFLWCDQVRITEVLRQQQYQRTAASSDITFVFELNTFSRSAPLQRRLVHDAIKTILRRVVKDFEESRELLEEYTTKRKQFGVSQLVESTSSNHLGFGIAEPITTGRFQPRDHVRGRKSAMGFAQSSKWTLSDKRRLTQLVNHLRQSNDGLQSIFDMLESGQMRRRLQLFATTTSLAFAEMAGRDPEEEQTNDTTGPESADRDELLRRDEEELPQLIQMYRRSHEIDRDVHLENMTGRFSQQTLSPAVSLFVDEYHLLFSDVTLLNTAEAFPQKRQHGKYRSNPVVVEWKYYTARLDPERLILLKKRVSMLASQLQKSSQTSNFNTMRCAGYFDDSNKQRIGIVFGYPQPNITKKPFTLKERLMEDRAQGNVRDLTSRLAVAKALVMTIYRLHLVGWLHKSFRSENIIFFESIPQSRYSLGTPFVSGFDFSRQDAPSEMTEDVPSVLSMQHMDRERSLFRHPDLDIHPCVVSTGNEYPEDLESLAEEAAKQGEKYRYRKSYDVYSLGIVLLELGLWQPVKGLFNRHHSLEASRDRMHKKLLPELRYRVGNTYYEVVKRCLEGDVGQAQMPAGTQAEGDDPELDALRETRIWLAGFDKYVVSELEKCNV